VGVAVIVSTSVAPGVVNYLRLVFAVAAGKIRTRITVMMMMTTTIVVSVVANVTMSMVVCAPSCKMREVVWDGVARRLPTNKVSNEE